MLSNPLDKLRIQVIAEDTVGYDTPYLGQHGIAMLLTAEKAGRRFCVLVDVAQDPAALLENMRRMEIAPRTLDAVVLTHCHYDHTRGIARVLAEVGKTEVPVVAHPELFRPHFITDPFLRCIGMADADRPEEIHKSGGRLCLTRDPLELTPGLATTGEVPRQTGFEQIQMPLLTLAKDRLRNDTMADDLSVIAAVAGCGLVVVTGCSHAGIVNICRHAMDLTDCKHLHGIIGGLHLLDADDMRIAQTTAALEHFKPDWIRAGHCTGFRAQMAFHQTFGDRFQPMYTGMHLEIGSGCTVR